MSNSLSFFCLCVTVYQKKKEEFQFKFYSVSEFLNFTFNILYFYSSSVLLPLLLLLSSRSCSFCFFLWQGYWFYQFIHFLQSFFHKFSISLDACHLFHFMYFGCIREEFFTISISTYERKWDWWWNDDLLNATLSSLSTFS